MYCFFWYLFQGGFLCYLRGHGNKSMQIGECPTCDKIWDRHQ